MTRKSDSIRWGLCCQFVQEPISFRSTTAARLLALSEGERRARLSAICLENSRALLEALRYCGAHGIGCFRILSSLFPVKTHPQVQYRLDDLPDAAAIRQQLEACRQFASAEGLRTVLHPDQFVVLNSPRAEVVSSSIVELESQAEWAELVGADVINIHAGGAYGDKAQALKTLAAQLDRLSPRVRSRLTLENDDTLFTPRDLLPLCRDAAVPLVYDVHHHRCLPDGWTVKQATNAAISTWNREPLMHVSSPAGGWKSPQPRRHADYIDPCDFPAAWKSLPITVEVEAKAKEQAVARLRNDLLHPRRRPPRKTATPRVASAR